MFYLAVFKNKRRYVFIQQRKDQDGLIVATNVCVSIGDAAPVQLIASIAMLVCTNTSPCQGPERQLGKWDVADGGVGSLVGGKSWTAFERDSHYALVEYSTDGMMITPFGWDAGCYVGIDSGILRIPPDPSGITMIKALMQMFDDLS